MEKLIQLLSEMDNPVVIASKPVLDEIIKTLSEKKTLIKATFRSFQDAVSDLLGEYRVAARIELAKEENISPELAQIKLDNSLIASSEYQNAKIHELLRIKNKYRSYLNINPLAEKLYENRPVLLVEAFFESDSFQKALAIIRSKTTVINYRFENHKKKHKILEFADYKAEIESLVHRVAKLLASGVAAERIKIQKVPDTYLSYLKEAFLLADIAIDVSDNFSLYEYESIQDFLETLKKYPDEAPETAFEKALVLLNKENPLLKDLVRVLNLYVSETYPIRDIYDDLVFELKRATPTKESYSKQIVVADYQNHYLSEDDFLFLVGFNQDLFPNTYLDEEFLLDYERKKLGLFTSRDKNQAARMKALALLNGNAAVELSYSINHQGLKIPLSGLANMFDYEIEKTEREGCTYQPKLDQIRLGKLLDLYYRYSETGPELFRLYSTWPDISYRTYRHRFTGVDLEDIKLSLEKRLSYTAIDQYYRCSFLYYLERVLGIKRSSNDEALFIGNLFHSLLENLLSAGELENPEEFLKTKIQEYLSENEINLSAKDRFFIGKYLEILLRFHKFLQEEREYSSLKLVDLEKSFRIPLQDGFVFEGKIDKILAYNHGGEDYYVVVDYKSGGVDIDLNRMFYGLNMQIPIYFYLLLRSGVKLKFGGGYLQKVLPNTVFGRDPKLSYEEQFYRYFRKVGYSPDDRELLAKIDLNYENPKSTLQGIRITKSGFHAESKRFLLSEEDFQKIMELVETKIREALENIKNGAFNIDPKLLGKFDSCAYCSYRDLCFRDESDYQRLAEYKNFSFLRRKDDTEEA